MSTFARTSNDLILFFFLLNKKMVNFVIFFLSGIRNSIFQGTGAQFKILVM